MIGWRQGAMGWTDIVKRIDTDDCEGGELATYSQILLGLSWWCLVVLLHAKSWSEDRKILKHLNAIKIFSDAPCHLLPINAFVIKSRPVFISLPCPTMPNEKFSKCKPLASRRNPAPALWLLNVLKFPRRPFPFHRASHHSHAPSPYPSRLQRLPLLHPRPSSISESRSSS